MTVVVSEKSVNAMLFLAPLVCCAKNDATMLFPVVILPRLLNRCQRRASVKQDTRMLS
jgi:hypothetical protein